MKHDEKEFDRLMEFYDKNPKAYLAQLCLMASDYLKIQDTEIQEKGKPTQTTWDCLNQIEALLKKAQP